MLFDFYKFCTWSVTKKKSIKSIYIALNKKIRLVKSTWVYFKNEFSDVIYSNFTFFYPRVPILPFLTSWHVCRSAKNLTFKNSDRIIKLVNFAILLCRENIHLVKSFFEEQYASRNERDSWIDSTKIEGLRDMNRIRQII